MFNDDHDALRAAVQDGVSLCTLVDIEGTFSRRRGAQLAVLPDGSTVGSLSDGCLEAQLAGDCARARTDGKARLMRYGRGSPAIDFRLPCGGGIDVLVDPAPERAMFARALDALEARRPVSVDLPLPEDAPSHLLRARDYIPALRVLLFGEGPERSAFENLARATGLFVESRGKAGEDKPGLSLGRAPENIAADGWTAILLLFHDHEWERAILRWALSTPAFYIGAQGGGRAREQRAHELEAMGFDAEACARVASPIGLIPRTRDPGALALSALAEIVACYGALHPHSDGACEGMA